MAREEGTVGEGWRRYLQAERRQLELRRGGLLVRLLGAPLVGESPEELARLAEEARRAP